MPPNITRDIFVLLKVLVCLKFSFNEASCFSVWFPKETKPDNLLRARPFAGAWSQGGGLPKHPERLFRTNAGAGGAVSQGSPKSVRDPAGWVLSLFYYERTEAGGAPAGDSGV